MKSKVATTSVKMQVGFKGLSLTEDEGILDPAYSPRTYNFTFEGGVLKSGLGIDVASGYFLNSLVLRHEYPMFSSGVNIMDVFAYTRRTNGNYDDRLIAQTDENKLYYTKIFVSDTWHEITGLTVSGKLCAVSYNYNGDDVILISGENNGLILINGETVTPINAAPRFSSLAVHFERIYGTVNGDTNQIWFSDDFNPQNWTVDPQSAGYITFADDLGDVTKVVSFLGYVYVFREHGVFRLTAYGEQSEFSLKKVFIDTGRIYKDTIAVCGDRIVFLAEEGLFTFDGYDTSRNTKELPKIITKNTAVGAYHDNMYYLAIKTSLGSFYSGTCVNNALLRYDMRDKSLSMLAPLDIKTLYSLGIHHATDMLVVLASGTTNTVGMIGEYGRVFGAPTLKLYDSPENDLNSEKVKIVKHITLTTKYALTLTVTLDGVPYAFELSGSSMPQTVFVGRSGKKIKFSLSTTSQNAYVTPMSVEMDLMR